MTQLQTAAILPLYFNSLSEQGILMNDLNTSQSSLEDIFVSMVRKEA